MGNASLNEVRLMGNLTADPEMKDISTGTKLAKLRVAANRKYKNNAGEWCEEATFVNVDVWGKQAENCAEYLRKGSHVYVGGRLQTRSWEAEDGTKRFAMDVVADRVLFLGGKKDQAPKAENTDVDEILI